MVLQKHFRNPATIADIKPAQRGSSTVTRYLPGKCLPASVNRICHRALRKQALDRCLEFCGLGFSLGGRQALPGHASHQHEHEQHGVILRRHMPTQGIKYQWRIPYSSASQYPDEKVCVLYTIVRQCIVLPALHKRDGLQTATHMLALSQVCVCISFAGVLLQLLSHSIRGVVLWDL